VDIPFIDIHTHHPVNSEEIHSVSSLFLQEVDLQINKNTPFSAAIHPWHAAQFSPVQVSAMLENLTNRPGLIAIGETGLDKVCTVDYELQKLLFELHLGFAEKHRIPLIIHAVKSWNELIVYLKRAKVPFIFHGYTGGIELTKQLINLGAYFSAGKSALRITPRFREAIQIIPLPSLFLETDDSLIDIREIYHEVAKIRGIPLEELKIQINKNYENLFSMTETDKNSRRNFR